MIRLGSDPVKSRTLTATQRAVYEHLLSGGVIRHRSTRTSSWGNHVVYPAGRPCYSITARTVFALRNAGLLSGEDVSLDPGLTQPRYVYWAKGCAKPEELRRK